MRYAKLWVAALAAIALLEAAPSAKVRPPGVAGAFYPADPKELAATVDDLLKKASPPPVADFVALVAPHAGYQFSGHVAAASYALLKGRKYTRVVVISPSHVDAFGFASVYDGGAYSTPLGQVPVDRDFAAKLAGKGSLIRLSSTGHTVSGERSEHALEVQLPFLQRALGQFLLVPVVMGDQSYETCRALGIALAKLAGPDTLIVASSDLSHFHKYDEAVKLDRKTLKAIEEWDYLSMSRNFESQVWEACGGGPIVAAMIAAEKLGAKQARILKYANSGDVTNDRSRVVGYGAVVLERAPRQGRAVEAFTLSEAERSELLSVARKSVETAVREHKLLEISGSTFLPLMQERGAFVTLKIKGALRGCIGYPSPIKPLCLTVRDVAAMAAVEDNRFRPVSIAELPQLEYEISVMSPLHHVLDTRDIQVGRHGLVLKRGRREGLLLPQVPVEQGWDVPTFLEELCLKAGLPQGSWKAEDADLFSFTGLVFSERKAPAPHSKRPSAPPS